MARAVKRSADTVDMGQGQTEVPSEQAVSPARRLRALFAKREDPYAGADPVLARRMVALMWALAGVLAIVFLPFAPPTEPLGWVGWPILLPMIAGTFVVARFLLRGGPHATFEAMLALSYLGLVELAIAQWLTGGRDSAFAELYLLAVIAGVAVHPPRRAVVLLLALVGATLSPVLYEEPAVAGELVPQLLLWLALGFVVIVAMHNLRAQRVRMRAAEQRAEATARLDGLTRVGNRRAFDEALEEEIARARRDDASLALIVMDIDAFKAINDAWGHAEGDRVLCAIAEALRDTIRAGDRCFRWGGDEFAVLLPAADQRDALQLCSRVKARLVALAPEFEYAVELSCGIAELTADDDPPTFAGRADVELMAGKARRRRPGSTAEAGRAGPG